MEPRTRTLLIGGAVAAVLFLAMGLITWNAPPWQAGGNETGPADANDMSGITGSLFGSNVIAFEVLGVLLTAAMIGALVIARPLEAKDDRDRYTHPSDAQQAESDAASDPEQHPLEEAP